MRGAPSICPSLSRKFERPPVSPNRNPTVALLIGVAFALLPKSTVAEIPGQAVSPVEFKQMRITDTWARYDGRLTWGRGQVLAILDDGCDLKVPQWQVSFPWGKKVIASYDAIDGDDDPAHVPPGYHGTSVGFPSSLNYLGKLGVAFNNQVAHVRAVTVVHLPTLESATIAAGLRWVIDNHRKYRITAVNLAALDDQRHKEPVPTGIDEPLREMKKLGIWVSAPCGNHHYTDGISWPACQPDCFAIGATKPERDEVHLDRYRNTDILVPAKATSSSNAFITGASMILREAIDTNQFDWHAEGPTLPDAMMAIFKKTGPEVFDRATGVTFRRLDLLAAVDYVFARSKRKAGGR